MSEQNLVTLKIDGKEVSVPNGTLIIRAAEKLGIHIPRFCDHPLLKPVAACRQCLVEVAMPDREGNIRPMPKPQPSCAMTVVPNMEVKTQLASEVVEKAQQGVMEFMLLNHPLDCPVCDKAGQCPLQDHSYQVGRTKSRFVEEKRIKEKPVALTNQILLDRERCILCQRCVRFAREIAGDPFIDLQQRGTREEIGRFAPDSEGNFHKTACCGNDVSHETSVNLDNMCENGQVFSSYFSGNIMDICPVGALTSATYRFKARPFDLVTHEIVSDFDSSGTFVKADIRNNKILRQNAGENFDVNENWISDKERFGYTWQNDNKRITNPIIDGEVSTWSKAYQKLLPLLETRMAFLPGGSLTVEDSYAWSKFARIVGKTNAIDFRYRYADINEEKAIYNYWENSNKANYSDIEKADNVILVDFEPEEECPSIFLKLYKNVTNRGAKVYSYNPFLSVGSSKLKAKLLSYKTKGTDFITSITENNQIADLVEKADAQVDLNENDTEKTCEKNVENTVIIVGEKATDYLSQVMQLAEKLKASIAFVPRRISETSGYKYGLTANLLPNLIHITDSQATQNLAEIWGVNTLPEDRYSGYEQILDEVIEGKIQTLFIGGVDFADYPNQTKLEQALEKANVVSLEVRQSRITQKADIVFPIAPPSEKNATFVNWCGQKLPFGQLFTTTQMSDRELLTTIAQLSDVNLNLHTLSQVHEELEKVEKIEKTIKKLSIQEIHNNVTQIKNEQIKNLFVLATSKTLLDDGSKISDNLRLQKGSRKNVIRISQERAEHLSVKNGDLLLVNSVMDAGGQSITNSEPIILPVQISQMGNEKIIWLPQNAKNSKVYTNLKVNDGSYVIVEKLETLEQTHPNYELAKKVLEEN